jgi:DNA-dependent RNA polymerase auxiliary subunit epsilon
MNEGNGLELIASPLFPLTFSANTFMNDWMPNAEADIFRYRDEKHVNEKLKCLDIPVLIEIGTADDSALVVDKDKVDKYFKNNLNNYKLEYINDAPHNYLNYEMQLTTNIKEWL